VVQFTYDRDLQVLRAGYEALESHDAVSMTDIQERTGLDGDTRLVCR
jgi:hypothetical protein